MVTIHALDRKLLRDLRRLRTQAVAIALVLACGIAIFLTGFGMLRSLESTQQDYYSRQDFAEVFASVRRALRESSTTSTFGELITISSGSAISRCATGAAGWRSSS